MNAERLIALIDALLDERLSEPEFAELSRQLRESSTARAIYWELVQQDVLLQDVVRESAGHDLARMALGETASNDVLLVADVERSERRPAAAAKWLTWAGLLAVFALLLAMSVRGLLVDEAARSSHRDVANALAEIRSLSGEVWLISARQAIERASSGLRFTAGEAVRVGEGGSAEVVLTDGSRLLLSGDSQLRFAAVNRTQQQLHLERGAAEVEAAPQSPERPLIFTTDQARLTVLGTRFRLYAGGADSRVELEEGKVRFERQSDGEAVEVVAGQFAVASADRSPTTPLVVEPLRAEWRLKHTLLRAGRRVVFAHGELRLATASDSKIAIWNVIDGTLQMERTRLEPFECLAFTRSNEAVVALNPHGQALFWRLDSSTVVQPALKTDRGKLRRCGVSRDGRWIAQTTDVDEGHIPVWQVNDDGTLTRVRSLPMKAGGVTVSATTTGPQVVASAWSGTTVRWEGESGQERTRKQLASQLHVLELSEDGRWFGGFGNKTGLVLIDLESGAETNLWPVGNVAVTTIRFSRDGRCLLAAMADGVVRAWSTENGHPLFVLATGDSRLESVDISDDGQWLAIAGDARRVTLWQCEPEACD